MNLKELLDGIGRNYSLESGLASPGHLLLRSAATTVAPLVPSNLHVKGSGGQDGFNRPTATPWIGIRDDDHAPNFQEGIYVVYLFAEDLKSLYLSLNQGTERLRKKLGNTGALKLLSLTADNIRLVLGKEIQGFDRSIDLRSHQNRARSYETGNIAAIKYSLEELPSNELLATDLRRFLDLYKRAADAKQDLVAAQLSPKQRQADSSGRGLLPARRRAALVDQLVTDPRVRNWVKALYENKCQFCEKLITSPSGNYSEAAHIRPKSHDGVDHESNVLCLCPNCHAQFDLGAVWIDADYAITHFKNGRVGKLILNKGHKVGEEHVTYQRTTIAKQPK